MMEVVWKGEGDRIRLKNGLTEDRLVSMLENSQKSQIPYHTGWDTAPNNYFKIASQLKPAEEVPHHGDTLTKALLKYEQRNKFPEATDDSDDEVDDTFTNRLFPSKHYTPSNITSRVDIIDEDVILEDLSMDSGCSGNESKSKVRSYNFSNDATIKTIPTSRSSITNLLDVSDPGPCNLTPSRRCFDGNISLIELTEDSTSSDVRLRPRARSLGQSSSKLKKTPITKRRSYGIRNIDDEYDDFADCVALLTESPVHSHVRRLLDGYEQKRIEKWEAVVSAKVAAWKEFEKLQELKIKETKFLSDALISVKQEAINLKWEARKKEIDSELEEKRRIQQLESDLLHKAFISQKETLDLEKKKKQLQAEERERKKLEVERERRLAEEKLALEEKQALLDAEKRKQLELEAEAERISLEKEQQKKIEEEIRAKEVSASAPIIRSDDTEIPDDFKGCILFSDLVKYSKTQDLLNSVKEKTTHISNNRSSNFHRGANNVVNTPLNQISSQTQVKITHFTKLLEGKEVYCAGLQTPFSISHERNGDLFIMNLLAFRFMKKAEAESSENLKHLSTTGVALIKQFPMWAEFVQAHFYKICPFLVPFAYPRRGMDICAYGAAIGHQFASEKDALDKLSGYCMLYGYMVKNFSSQSHPDKLTSSQEFFTSQEAWKIISKIVTLEPQEEVTATIINVLLEILGDHLTCSYGLQFKKLLKYIRKIFVEKIRQATSKGKGGSLAKLELFLDK